MDGDYLIIVYSIPACVHGGGIMYKINASETKTTMSCTNKSSIIVQILSVGVVPTTVCIWKMIIMLGGQGPPPYLPNHIVES